ncbi:uncharacterized protein LOC127787045 isoform X2 [Diospyros lotus]|uniref:uncharacterized protein LOC127787045 isoform X2 n=1 Tax=Diospyros lotus TaxID=55363 RepID=UPI0022543FBC|nr:uncharacterized protein LOC127787045 isoform X2 [Diospyros lotus]
MNLSDSQPSPSPSPSRQAGRILASPLSLSLEAERSMMAVLASSISAIPLSLCLKPPRRIRTRLSPISSSSSRSSTSSESSSSPSPPPFPDRSFISASPSANTHLQSSEVPDKAFNYAIATPNGNLMARLGLSTESTIERGCVYIVDAYKAYWACCLKGVHTGQMVLRLVEAIDVYLAGTVMLIFGMGLYGLFISNVPPDAPPSADRALKGSSLFGMFALKERPKWMKICSIDELKTKVGHVIVMILLVKMFERSKMVTITTGVDLLSYSVCIFLSAASLYILNNLHKSEKSCP